MSIELETCLHFRGAALNAGETGILKDYLDFVLTIFVKILD